MNFEDDIKNSLRILKEGGVILYPTDTVWGLGCDATNSAGIGKIFRIKPRSDSKSLIILVDSIWMLERYVREVPAIAYELIDVSDKPLTIIYPKAKNIAPEIPAEDGSVGIRICSDVFCTELIGRKMVPSSCVPERFRMPTTVISVSRPGISSLSPTSRCSSSAAS